MFEPRGDRKLNTLLNAYDRLTNRILARWNEFSKFKDISNTVLYGANSEEQSTDTDTFLDANIDIETITSDYLFLSALLYKAWIGYQFILSCEKRALHGMVRRDYPIITGNEILDTVKKELGEDFHLHPWIEMSEEWGVYVAWDKSDTPNITNLQQVIGEKTTIGNVIHELMRDRNKKNDFSPLSDECFDFFIRYLSKLINNNKEGALVVASFFEYASSQTHLSITDPIVSEGRPTQIKSIQNSEDAWQKAVQCSSFANAFFRRLIISLTDIDDPFHEITITFLEQLSSDPELKKLLLKEADSGLSIAESLIVFLINEDSLMNQNTLIPLIRSILQNYLDEKTRIKDKAPLWAREFYERFQHVIETAEGIVFTSDKLVKTIGTTSVLAVPLHELSESVEYTFLRAKENEDQRITIFKKGLQEFDIDTEFFQAIPSISNMEDYYIFASPDEENELINIQLILIDETKSAYVVSYSVDVSTDSYEVYLNLTNPDHLQKDKDFCNVLLSIFHQTILAEKKWELLQENIRNEKAARYLEQKKEKKNITNPNNPTAKYEPPKSRVKGKPQRYHSKQKKNGTNSEKSIQESTQELIQRVHTRRNVQSIIIPSLEDEIWKAVDDQDLQIVVDKIRDFNAALESENIIANCKVFVGELRGPNGRRLMQIRCNGYRVLCELGTGKGSKAQIHKIFKKSNVAEIY